MFHLYGDRLLLGMSLFRWDGLLYVNYSVSKLYTFLATLTESLSSSWQVDLAIGSVLYLYITFSAFETERYLCRQGLSCFSFFADLTSLSTPIMLT